MNNALLKLYMRLQALKNGEDGQDLVEYGLLRWCAFRASATWRRA
jgi:hypothetical protein